MLPTEGQVRRMMMQGKGTFEIKSTPHAPYDSTDGVTVGRMTFDKQFQGDLEATSVVEMLYARTPVEGSAAYVAIERIRGALKGKAGAFVVHHTGIMNDGKQTLTIDVVPGSGTGALTGLRGRMTIEIVDGKHFYAFDGTLDER